MTRQDGRYTSPTRDGGDAMNTRPTSLTRVVGPAIVVIVPLVAAAWLPTGFPHLVRQVLLCIWGVGAILITERRLFSDTLKEALRAVGFVRSPKSTLAVVLLASLPMWAFLPLFAWINGTAIDGHTRSVLRTPFNQRGVHEGVPEIVPVSSKKQPSRANSSQVDRSRK